MPNLPRAQSVALWLEPLGFLAMNRMGEAKSRFARLGLSGAILNQTVLEKIISDLRQGGNPASPGK